MNCFRGNVHVGELQEIYRHASLSLEEAVVKWCPICGAIVVDSESDGRVNPGQVQKMRFPSWCKKGKGSI